MDLLLNRLHYYSAQFPFDFFFSFYMFTLQQCSFSFFLSIFAMLMPQINTLSGLIELWPLDYMNPLIENVVLVFCWSKQKICCCCCYWIFYVADIHSNEPEQNTLIGMPCSFWYFFSIFVQFIWMEDRIKSTLYSKRKEKTLFHNTLLFCCVFNYIENESIPVDYLQ